MPAMPPSSLTCTICCFAQTATRRADVLGGVLADLEKAFVAMELAIKHPHD
jgi:hypothetical protein